MQESSFPKDFSTKSPRFKGIKSSPGGHSQKISTHFRPASNVPKGTFLVTESLLDDDLKHWEEYQITGPQIERRCYHSAIVHGDYLYIYGGYEYNIGMMSDFKRINLGSNAENYVWEDLVYKEDPIDVDGEEEEPDDYSVSNLEPRKQNKPPRPSNYPGALARHIAVVYEDSMYIYGGQKCSTENTADMFKYDLIKQTWKRVTPDQESQMQPPSLDSHTAGVWENQMIVFGGFIGADRGECANHVLAYDFRTNKWETLFQHNESEKYPAPRMAQAMAIVENSLLVFGGTNGEDKFNDLWKFDLQARTWQLLKPEDLLPEPRNGLTMTVYKDYLVIFGGIFELTHEKNDIFAYHIPKNKWILVESDSKLIKDDEIENDKPTKSFLEHKLSKDFNEQNSSAQNFETEMSAPFNEEQEDQGQLASKKNADLTRNRSNFFKQKSVEGLERSTTLNNLNNSKLSHSVSHQVLKKWDKVPLQSPNNKTITEAGATNSFLLPLSTLEERKKKGREISKKHFLRDLDLPDDKKEGFLEKDPTLDSMKQALKIVGDLHSLDKGQDVEARKIIDDYVRAASLSKVKITSTMPGKKPRSRDGHSGVVLGQKWIIFGGDRHKMSFHDMFALNLSYFDKL